MPNRYPTFRNVMCAYCGQSTGPDGQAEHVIPRNIYPASTPSTFQRLTIPSCPDCNAGFSSIESHFRNVVLCCGPDLSPDRRERWLKAMRSLSNERYGDSELERIWSRLVFVGTSAASGNLLFKIDPLRDDDVCRVFRKIVRGLAYDMTGTVIQDRRVQIIDQTPIEEALPDFTLAYRVGDAISCEGCLLEGNELMDPVVRENIHSFWRLRFYDLVALAIVLNGSLPSDA